MSSVSSFTDTGSECWPTLQVERSAECVQPELERRSGLGPRLGAIIKVMTSKVTRLKLRHQQSGGWQRKSWIESQAQEKGKRPFQEFGCV